MCYGWGHFFFTLMTQKLFFAIWGLCWYNLPSSPEEHHLTEPPKLQQPAPHKGQLAAAKAEVTLVMAEKVPRGRIQ